MKISPAICSEVLLFKILKSNYNHTSRLLDENVLINHRTLTVLQITVFYIVPRTLLLLTLEFKIKHYFTELSAVKLDT